MTAVADRQVRRDPGAGGQRRHFGRGMVQTALVVGELTQFGE